MKCRTIEELIEELSQYKGNGWELNSPVIISLEGGNKVSTFCESELEDFETAKENLKDAKWSLEQIESEVDDDYLCNIDEAIMDIEIAADYLGMLTEGELL